MTLDSPAPQVVVIGSSNTDMVVRAPHIPAPGETLLGGDLLMTGGGKGANQAVAAARFGARTALIACVGGDLFGDQALSTLAGYGVDTQWIRRDSQSPSGVAMICVDGQGQNAIVVAPGANGRLSPGDIDRAMPAIAACSVVAAQLEVPLETVTYGLQRARALGKTTILNPAPAMPLPATLLQNVDVLITNEIEASMLTDIDASLPAALAAALRDAGSRTVIVTLGGQGALLADDHGVEKVPAFRVTPVDTTAAGDCFTGALAAALAEGMPLRDAASLASAAAAISVTRPGAQASLPSRAEAQALAATAGFAG